MEKPSTAPAEAAAQPRHQQSQPLPQQMGQQPPRPAQGPSDGPEGDAPTAMPADVQEMFSNAILRVVVPVVITMLLSIYLTHSVPEGGGCPEPPTPPATSQAPIPIYKERPPGELVSIQLGRTVDRERVSVSTLTTIIFLSSFLGCMVIFTFVLVLLYKYRCEKIIIGWLFFAVTVIFGWEGGRYLWDWSQANCFPLDFVTLGFVVWNFAVMGIVSIFWRSPRLVNQTFLILLSALMSYIFRTLPEWATWTILGLLVFWDIIAVLTPCGPLRMLVEIAKERGDPLPALVYDTNPEDVGRGTSSAAPAKVTVRGSKPKDENSNNQDASQVLADASVAGTAEPNDARARRAGDYSESHLYEAVPTREEVGPVAQSAQASASGSPSTTPPAVVTGAMSGHAQGAVTPKKKERQLGYFGAHLKLGLGDFVFYSVLVSRSSLNGFMTTVTSFIAILTGLVLTLFLVTVYKKALPALPISITLGLIFYGATRYTVEPYIANIMPELLFP